MKWVRTALAIFVATAASGPRAARADPAALPLELIWDVPEGCPDAAFVVHRVEQILRGPPTVPGSVLARGTIQKTGEAQFALRLTVRTVDDEDTRSIEAASCSALAEASAVVIALAIDPTKETLPPAIGPPPRETPLPEPKAPAPRKRSVVDERAAPPKPRIALGLGTAIDWGTLPRLGVGLFASGALDLQRLRVGLLGAFSFRQRPIFEPGAGAGASFDLLAVGAFGAYMVPLGTFAFGPAANLELTYLRVQGFGIRDPRASWTGWPTAVLGARGELALVRRVRALARIDMLLPLSTPTVILGAPGSTEHLYEPALPAVRFSLGAEIVLP